MNSPTLSLGGIDSSIVNVIRHAMGLYDFYMFILTQLS